MTRCVEMGWFKDGKLHGYGKRVTQDEDGEDEVTEGIWENGEFSGRKYPLLLDEVNNFES